MKRFAFLVVLLLIGLAAYAATVYDEVRMDGTNAVLGGNAFYVICDSSDTAVADTQWSDTVDVLEARYVNVVLKYTDAVLADSANDSLLVIVHTLTAAHNAPERTIYTDTFFDTNAVTTPLALKYHAFRADTMLYDKLYFRTIVKDSFILGAGVDTTTVRVKAHVIQRQ